MTDFRLTQISDTHLSRRYPSFTENFDRACEHIATTRPDLVINTGDLGFDGFDYPDDLAFAKAEHGALAVDCRYLPGNHDLGDNPTQVGPAPTQLASAARRQAYRTMFGEDRWRFDAAGWSFIGLNSLIMNTGLACEVEQSEWLRDELSRLNGKPLALFLHKPLFLNTPDDPESEADASRYVPKPARGRLVDMLSAVDLRLVASGHVHQRRDSTRGSTRHIWAPSTGFILRSNEIQEVIGIKEVGLVEYCFRPDGFEVRHVHPTGLVDHDGPAIAAEPGRRPPTSR
jgi:3',5'-cyclic AMP phosphodiesterase CpdA